MLKKRSQIVAIFTVLILLAVLIPQHSTNASFDDWCFSIDGCVLNIGKLLLGLVGEAIGWIAQGFDAFLKWQISSGVYDLPAIRESWTIIRNFVNLFFILILIIMAFGTIFNIQKYTWKDMLAPFLVSALLINFSLAIGQYIISISNGLAGVFLNQISSSGDISLKLATGFSQANIITATTNNGAIIVRATDAIIGAGSTLIFGIIWLILVLLAFASAFIFTIARFFVLWFLLIISPLAWIGYALPNKRSETWGKWWNSFLCWCFFLPYYLFFLMFAVIFINSRSQLQTIGSSLKFGSLTFNNLIVFGVSLVFLVGGLAIARKLACASGSGVSMAFGKIETGVRKYAPGAAYVRGAAAGVKERGAEIAERGVLGIGGAQRARLQEAEAKGFVAGMPGLPGKVPGAREAIYRAQASEVDKEVKRLQTLNLTLDQLNEKLASAKGMEKLAAFKIKSENGWLVASDVDEINKILADAGGGKTALGSSIISSLKKGKFNEMALGTADKERIFNTLEDIEVKKAFGLDMAESREIMSASLAKTLLDLYGNDSKEVQNKVEKAVKENIENIARDASARKELIQGTGAFAGADRRLRAMAGETAAGKKEVDTWKLRRQVLELNGGIDPTTGEAKTPEGRKLAKDIGDGNIVIQEEATYRKNNPGSTNHATDLVTSQHDALSNQILANIENKLITSFTTEELKTPEVFNALFNGYLSGRITVDQFNRLIGFGTGKKGGGKPDRKKREAGAKIQAAVLTGTPMPYI